MEQVFEAVAPFGLLIYFRRVGAEPRDLALARLHRWRSRRPRGSGVLRSGRRRRRSGGASENFNRNAWAYLPCADSSRMYLGVSYASRRGQMFFVGARRDQRRMGLSGRKPGSHVRRHDLSPVPAPSDARRRTPDVRDVDWLLVGAYDLRGFSRPHRKCRWNGCRCWPIRAPIRGLEPRGAADLALAGWRISRITPAFGVGTRGIPGTG